MVKRTTGSSFIKIGPKLGVLILAIGESLNMAILRVPLKETAVTEKFKNQSKGAKSKLSPRATNGPLAKSGVL